MLAKDLGMTVEHMLNTMTSSEFTYWYAFYRLENEEVNKHKK